MKTILYNTNTQEITQHAKEGYYLVDGVRPTLPKDMVELTIVEETQPSYDPETQKITSDWVIDLTAKEYRKEFTVVNLTPKELAAKAWKHTDFSTKLIIDESVGGTPVGSKHFIRFENMGNPVEYDKANKQFSVWVNSLDTDYQNELQGFIDQGLITVENRPSLLS